ncbi:MAG TPA: hypothetical protein VN921_01925 [Chthoniobacterales bacterium]|nr:hypothetical protein [Chthoniobacterales bacterium]
MRLRLTAGKTNARHSLVAAGFIGVFLFALVLSATPQLHERIHKASADASHQCAVTLLASGHCQHIPSDAVSIAPPAPRPGDAFSHRNFEIVPPCLDFSLLEHAPPVLS